MSPLQYRLLRRTESGALAEHYEATTDTGNTVVVKLFAEKYSDPEYGLRLQDTARVLNPIDAPELLRYLEIGVVKRRLAVTRESVDGFSFGAALSKLNTRDVVLPSTIALFWVVELLDAVERAHEAGLVHGAITPGNALITRAGEVRICDFGALEALQASPVLRKAFGGETGRASYRAPEILKGELATPESDVYSIAALAYELLTLREPARGPSAGMSTRRDALPPPSRIDRRLNARLDPILMRALEPEPNRRFRSCAELSQGLRRFLSENGGIPNADELRRCGVELAPPAAPAGPVPFPEPFTLDGLDGDDLDELPERSAVMTLRPSFSGGAFAEAEYPETAATMEAPPAFPEYRPETRNGRPPQPKEEPAQVDTNPGQAGPLEAGWEAPPGTAVYKPKRKDNERSIVGAAPQRHPRVKVIEDFQGPPLASSSSKPAPRADGERSEVSRSGRRDPERSRVRPPPPKERDERYEQSVSSSMPRPMRTEERKLIAAMRKNQRLLLLVSIIALFGALGFAFAIWQLHQDRDRKAVAVRPHVTQPSREPAPVVRPPVVAPRPDPVVVVKPPPPPPERAEEEVALYVPPPRSIAGFLTVIANVPARVYIDGAKVPRRTPLKKYPVHPGSRLIVVEAVGTGDKRVFNVNVVRGKLRKINELDLAARPR